MGKKHKRSEGISRNRKNVRFETLEKVLLDHGWQLFSVRGSHHVYQKPGRLPLLIVKPHGKFKYCHPRDVDKVVEATRNE